MRKPKLWWSALGLSLAAFSLAFGAGFSPLQIVAPRLIAWAGGIAFVLIPVSALGLVWSHRTPSK
ncbi:MAG: hypothetical protein U0R49_11090 [Fimbriimonadales bacterium]